MVTKKKDNKKNSVKRSSSTKGRKQCEIKGCRRMRVPGATFCTKHYEENDAIERVVKITEVEALRFSNHEIEMRNRQQQKQLISYKIAELRNNINTLENSKAQYEAEIKAMQPAYIEFVTGLAKKYNISSPANMTIDTDTRIIRDLSKH